jgi:hypothetical protein
MDGPQSVSVHVPAPQFGNSIPHKVFPPEGRLSYWGPDGSCRLLCNLCSEELYRIFLDFPLIQTYD